jgi:WD40 repeat protein/transcriptional regulator with XRE-family HTH domain
MKRTATLALRQEREKRGWSRNYVAEHIEVDVITVGRWERGERMPHPHHRQKLCNLFEMNAQELGLLSTVTQDADVEIVALQETGVIHIPADDSRKAQIGAKVEPSMQQMPEAETHVVDIDVPTNQNISGDPDKRYNRRKLLIAGLVGGLGIVAASGGGMLFLSHPSTSATVDILDIPNPMPASKCYHHLLDPSTDNYVNYVAWSPDNSMMGVATGSNLISVWDIAKETILLNYPTLNGWVNDISWSKNNIIAAAMADHQNGSLQLWEYPKQKPVFTLRRSYGLRSVAWSPNDVHLAVSGHTSTVEVWEPSKKQVVSHYSYPALGLLGIRRVKWSPSGKFLACATDDGTAHVWEALSGNGIMIYRGHKSRLIDLSWSPDERYITTCGEDKTCQVWEAFSGRSIVTYRGHAGAAEAVAWSPYGNVIASGSADTTVHVWEALTGKLITKYVGNHSIVEAVRWSVDGTILAIGLSREGVEIWQAPGARTKI